MIDIAVVAVLAGCLFFALAAAIWTACVNIGLRSKLELAEFNMIIALAMLEQLESEIGKKQADSNQD